MNEPDDLRTIFPEEWTKMLRSARSFNVREDEREFLDPSFYRDQPTNNRTDTDENITSFSPSESRLQKYTAAIHVGNTSKYTHVCSEQTVHAN